MSEPFFKKSKLIFVFCFLATVSFCVISLQKPALAQNAKYTLIEIKTENALPTGYSLSLSFDHKLLVANDSSLLSGDDIRIFYDPNGEFNGNEREIDVILDELSNWNEVDTKLWFKLQNDLAENFVDSIHYRLYYGGTYENLPLREKSKVYYLFDDFSDEILSDWEFDSNAASWQETDGILKSESNGAQIKNTLLDVSDYFVQVQIRKINPNQYVGILARLIDFNKFYLFSRDRNAHDWRLNRNYNGQWNFLAVNDGLNEPKNGDTIGLKIIKDHVEGYLNDQKVLELSDSAIGEGTVGLFTNGENSATEFDNFIVRKAVQNEPSVNLVWDLVTPSPTILPSVSPTETLTPTPILMPDPQDESINILSAETYDSNSNGKIDQIRLQFNVDLNGSSVTNSDFSVISYALSSNKAQEENGLVTLYLTEANYFDTGNKPEVIVRNQGVKDLNNNWNTEIKVMAQDKAKPYVILDSPVDSNYYFDNNINFSGISSDYSSAEDSVVVLTKIFYKKQETSQWHELATLSNDSFLEPFEWSLHKVWTEGDGVYDFKIESYDLEGNLSENNLASIVIDSAKPLNPIVLSTSHLINEWSSKNIINFAITEQADADQIKNYYFSFGNVSDIVGVTFSKLNPGTNNFGSDKLKDGIYYLFFNTENKFGNSSEMLTLGPFKIDTEKPSLTLNYIKKLSQTSEINFQIFPSDELSGVNSVVGYFQDPQGNNDVLYLKNSAPVTFSFDTSKLTLFGDYLFSFKTTDNTGNSDTISTYIKIEPTVIPSQTTENSQNSTIESENINLTATPIVLASETDSLDGLPKESAKEFFPTVLGTRTESTERGTNFATEHFSENKKETSKAQEIKKSLDKENRKFTAVVVLGLLTALVIFGKYFAKIKICQRNRRQEGLKRKR